MRSASILVSVVALATAILAGCGQPRQRAPEYVPVAPRAARPGPGLPRPSIGGLFLGARYVRETGRCPGFQAADSHAGNCRGTPASVGYPVHSVFLRRCAANEVCQITVRVRVEGETQLQHGLEDVRNAWIDRYGAWTEPSHETDPVCESEILAGRYGCLLRGEGRFVETWFISTDRFDVPAGSRAQLTAFGAAGTQVATIRMTLATADGIRAAAARDL